MAFGLTTTSSTYTVDTGGGVVFSVLRQGTSSTIHSGDLTSFKLNGAEFAAPFSAPGPQRYSHFESGLSNSAVVTASVDPAGNWIKVSCDDTTATVGTGATGVIQYYATKKNDPVIYMATYAPEMLVSSTRFITYLAWNKFPNHPDQSDTSAISGTAQTAIESSDVYKDPVTGYTHSKYYAENRLVGHVYHGATGPGAGAFMFIGSRERGSGGPFWKDIDFQSTGAAVELYNIPFSGHSQTEAFRPGLHGPYALVLTNGSQPTVTPNYSFLDDVGLTGIVPASGRGTLTGTASNVPAGHEVTVALSSNAAQYWGTPDAGGHYTIQGIIPGTYTETLYQDELAVGTQTVTINAGATTAMNIVDTYYLPPAIWRIGTWDGTPKGFLNADKIADMHPSDPRLSPWADASGLTNFAVGTSADSDWPMAEWKYEPSAGPVTDIQNRITFNLTSTQASTPLTLRIGITRLDHGRPSVNINGTALAVPALTTQPDTRGLTLGSWRGNNSTFTFNLSTSQVHAGTNTIDIYCASGSGSGGNYLSPWHIYDAIDLVTTSSLTNAPRVASITVTPANPNVAENAQQTFIATARDQFGQITPANIAWSATRGVIDGTGVYTAPATPGPATITATSGSVSGNTSVNVFDNTPIQITASGFDYQTGQAVTFTFSKDVGPSIAAGDLLLENLTNGTTIRPSSIGVNYSPTTVSFSATTILPDGNYRATLSANSVQDSFGNHLAADAVVNFFILAGDANHDAAVDVSDLGILATNWQSTGMTFGQGDFNYDGVIDVTDLGILATNWQKNMPAPAAPSLQSAATVTPPRHKVHDSELVKAAALID
jgi:rhamnogalacturonan endolyase